MVELAGAGVGLHQGLDAPFDLIVVLRCEGFHHDAHWPDVVVADVRAADSFSGLALEEVRVVLAPDEPVRPLTAAKSFLGRQYIPFPCYMMISCKS